MRPEDVKSTPVKYTAKDGKVISKSMHHPDMWIVDSGDKFHTISGSYDSITILHPPKR